MSTQTPAPVTGAPLIEFNAEQLDVIRRVIAPDLTDPERALLIQYAKRTGLDPIAKQIYGFKDKRGRLSILTGIDGYRLAANRSGEMDGSDGPYWCDGAGKWFDVWLDTEPPTAAKITVYRKGHAHGYTAVARFSSYAKLFPGSNWERMPEVMIAKCAEALALRRAFPAELSGIYTREEMEQAGIPPEEPKRDPRKPQGVNVQAEAVVEEMKEPEQGWTCEICHSTIRKGAWIYRGKQGSIQKHVHKKCFDDREKGDDGAQEEATANGEELQQEPGTNDAQTEFAKPDPDRVYPRNTSGPFGSSYAGD